MIVKVFENDAELEAKGTPNAAKQARLFVGFYEGQSSDESTSGFDELAAMFAVVDERLKEVGDEGFRGTDSSARFATTKG